MKFRLSFTPEADKDYISLENDPGKKKIFKAVQKTLGYMETNLRHPSLKTHQYYGLHGPHGEKVFEAYAQQKTPGAYRVFWYYGPEKNELTILTIVPHPD